MATAHLQYQGVPSSRQFFEEQTDLSATKARIVSKYFDAWASVMARVVAQRPDKRIAYIDLFAGPGKYSDGQLSTPLLVLQRAIKQPRIAASLVAYFNDGNQEHARELRRNINQFPNIQQLDHAPKVTSLEINEDFVNQFKQRTLPPSFTFIDPFGYKELSLQLVESVISDWGCDCVFFFNYSRVNAAFTNSTQRRNIDPLFGKHRAAALRKRLPSLNPKLRQATILEALVGVIKQLQPKTYVLPFVFESSAAERTSHMLIFVSKHFKGYSIMKDIMAKESSTAEQEVPSFTYSSADASTPYLLPFTRPLSNLRASLLKQFAGQERTLKQIYEAHSPDTPFVEKNYRDVLRQLERESVVAARSTSGHRKPGTYPNHVLVKFPVGGNHGN